MFITAAPINRYKAWPERKEGVFFIKKLEEKNAPPHNDEHVGGSVYKEKETGSDIGNLSKHALIDPQVLSVLNFIDT